MMKRKFLLVLAVAAAGMLMLTACTSANNKNKDENTTGTSQTVEGTAENAGNAGTVEDSVQEQPEEVPGQDAAPEQGEPGYDGEPDGEIYPDEEAADQETPAADIWSGSYSDSDESVTVYLQEDGNISFSFAQSGISGTAQVNGTQAVFHGDDYHVVVFNISGDTLNISVSSEEDFDASASPLNGTYTKN